MKVVIIGGVAGGATAAARLRRLSEDVEIVMFEKDEYIAFANCGLPYYIGDVITDRSKLLVQTVEGMSSRYNLDIRNFSEVIKIDANEKFVEVLNHQTKETYQESFDKLIYTPGANPIVPNFIEDGAKYFTLRNIPDTDKIYDAIENNRPKNAVVIGGGFIGVEMAENLAERGIDVTLIDLAPHILKPFDYEMACELEFELKSRGVNVLTSTSVKSVSKNSVVLESGTSIESDMTILAIGVAPNGKLASEAGVLTTKQGHVIVNEKFETNLKDIYAVGDVIATNHFITNDIVNIPLASPANRQARLVADIIIGRDVKYDGVLGTSVLKVFSKTAAATGYTEEMLTNTNIDFDSIIVTRGNHAGYYPGSSNITLKLIFENKTGKILGAQAIGISGVEKRMDVIATAIKGGLTIFELEELELSYAPPFSSAKDPVNIAGYAASNILNDGIKMFKYNDIETLRNNNEVLIDVRTKDEFEMYSIEGFKNIDLDYIRENLDKLPTDKNSNIYITCQVGMRGYLAQKILLNLGYKNVFNLSGGVKVYKQVEMNKNKTKSSGSINSQEVKINDDVEVLDARGLQCPGPIKETFDKINMMEQGKQLKVLVTDCGFSEDIDAWCDKCGHTLNYVKPLNDGGFEALITKGREQGCKISEDENKDNGTIVMFSGDLDKALATMIIAQGAQAMGKQMTIFFTFWGLNVLRKSENVVVEKTLFEKMFGFMMPKGAKKLPLSNMNMGGMGAAMIKGRMKDKNVNLLPEQIKTAQEMGVKFIACTMSMDLMGIKKEELIDGVEFAGVAKYVGDSSGADLTLFI